MSSIESALLRIPGTLAIVCALLMMTVAPLSFAQSDAQRVIIETVTLQHRSPDSIREALQPRLLPGGRIGQIGEHLVIATTQQNLSELLAEIERLDVAPRLLSVRVDFNHGATDDDDESETAPLTGSYTMAEEETLVTAFDAGDTQRYLALSIVLQGQRARLSYGFSGSSDVIPDTRAVLDIGQWYVLDTETPTPQTPAGFLLQAAPPEGPGRRIAILVNPADTARTE